MENMMMDIEGFYAVLRVFFLIFWPFVVIVIFFCMIFDLLGIGSEMEPIELELLVIDAKAVRINEGVG